MKKLLIIIMMGLMIVTLTCLPATFGARDFVVSLAQMPGIADSPDKGVMVDLVKAMNEVYIGGKITINVVPYARALTDVVEGRSDFEMPSGQNPALQETLPYRYATERLGKITLVIYSNKDKIITRKAIDDAIAKGGTFPFVIETSPGLKPSIPFLTTISNDFDQSLMKVQNKRIDAVVRSQEETDMILKRLTLTSVHRAFYQYFEDVVVVAKGPKGDEVDQIISGLLRKLKASGKFQKIYNMHHPYFEWQP